MAAGLGSRYGGFKQVDRVGPSGEMLLEYAIFDAYRAGFAVVRVLAEPARMEDAFVPVGPHQPQITLGGRSGRGCAEPGVDGQNLEGLLPRDLFHARIARAVVAQPQIVEPNPRSVGPFDLQPPVSPVTVDDLLYVAKSGVTGMSGG